MGVVACFTTLNKLVKLMNKHVGAVAAVFLLICAPTHAATLTDLAEDNAGKSIAIVSISSNNFGNSLQGWNAANTSELMANRLNLMLEFTESLFAQDWEVVGASSFANSPEFQALAGEQRDVGLPMFGGQSMPLFSKNRKQLVRAEVDRDVAQELARIAGTDFVVIIYSEWSVATGRFVPTSKALAKNVVSVFDASGKQVYDDRDDQQGSSTLGAMGRVAVNEETIDQWVDAFQSGVNNLYFQGRRRN